KLTVLSGESYNLDGFTYVQTLIDRYYTFSLEKNPEIDVLKQFELQAQMYPYPPYIQDNGMSQLYGMLLPTMIVLSYILLVPSLIKNIVYEKETGVRELVRLMGLDGWLVWLGWFLHSFMSIVVTASIITIFLKVQIVSGSIPPIIINTDGFFLWFLLLMYGIASIAFCFALATFFTKPTLATALGVVALLISFFIPRGIMDYQYNTLGLAPKLLSCLLPNMCITWAFKVISMFEGRSVGVNMTNLWETGNPKDQLTPGMILIMLAVDTILFLIITWYVDQINPGQYGVPRPYYFPFQKTYWCGSKNMKSESTEKTNLQNIQNFEPEPVGLTPGIVIKNLRKEFTSMCNSVKVAVEDVTLTCYEGQCTVLLGHNGAGKTTTMSVLTGVYAPTSGSARVAGWDIAANLKEARAEVGLCPQHNMLFTDLSVNEHLIFFAKLKGLSSKEAETEAMALMKRLELIEKKNMFGKQLSGGMKRKLCLAISLIGGSKVIILDEPSSGLDPESRRWVWEVIQGERGQRTVLVTTHHMEEADVLGDRVAIMADGQVICSGSTLYLKKKFGDGYSLTVTINENSNVETISAAVTEHLPESRMTSSMGGEIIYRLPSDTSCFGTLLDSLTQQKENLGIKHVSLSLTSMEQVFLKVGGLLDNKNESLNNIDDSSQNITATNGLLKNKESLVNNGSHKSTEHISAINSTQNLYNSQDDMKQPKIKGWKLLLQRFKALFVKRFIYSKRKWVLFITQAILPVIVTIMCLLVDALIDENTSLQDVRNLTLSMYESSNSYVHTDIQTMEFGVQYQSYINDSVGPFTVEYSENVTRSLLDDSIINEFKYRENSICSAEFMESGENSTYISRYLYQSVPYHCPGVSVNIMNNAILRTVVGNDTFTIQTNNRPLPDDQRYRLGNSEASASSIIYSMMMPMALAFLSASFIIFPLEERESKAKQVQIMTGTPTWALWFTSLVWDLLSYIISAILVFIFFMLLDSKEFWTQDNAPGCCFKFCLRYVGCLEMLHPFISSYNIFSGNSINRFICVLYGKFLYAGKWALDTKPDTSYLSFFTLTPPFPSSNSIYRITHLSPSFEHSCPQSDIYSQGSSRPAEVCSRLAAQHSKSDTKSSENVEMDNPYEYCQPSWNITKFNLNNTVACFEKYSYFRWDEPGLNQHLLYLLADGFLYILLLTLIELGTWKYVVRKFRQCISRPSTSIMHKDNSTEDDDVVAEANLVKNMIQSGSQEAAMVVSGLTKQFPGTSAPAVNQLSFHVKRGECLGLLGVNGAGKTTTFRMLTADEDPSSGDAMIDGVTLRQNGGKKFLECIGYCPQFDATLGELTGFEMLMLVGRLRGIPESQIEKTTKTLINLVDIIECANRPSSTYSGGNRRKLSTAMALVGTPSLVFLDEPTSGVDPASRRRVWSAVTQAVANGQSVVLTSHSMEECEALCSRIVIMARGKLRCIGSTAHLKAKFGKGYSLQVKLRINDAMDYEKEVKKLKDDIQTHLPNTIVADEHKGMLAYKVPTSISWGKLFDVMEALKAGKDPVTGTEDRSAIVEDYAASDTSLEQVFLSFAREANDTLKESSPPC
ncbi:unnamed protein product, partial [Meganyctiphanes norvegica]